MHYCIRDSLYFHSTWGSVQTLPQILKPHLTMYTVFTFHILIRPKRTITQTNCTRNCNTHVVSCPTQLRLFTPASYKQLLNFCSPALRFPFDQTDYNVYLCQVKLLELLLLCLPHKPTQCAALLILSSFCAHVGTQLQLFLRTAIPCPALGQISTDRHHEAISSISPLHSVFLSLSLLWHLDFISPRCSSLPPRSPLSCNISYSSFRRPISSLPSLFCQTTSCIYKSILSRWNMFNSSVLSLSSPSDLQQMFDQAVPHCIIQRRVWAAVIRHVCLTWCIGSV